MVVHGPTSELPHRRQMESWFGVDLGGVEIHRSDEAEAACAAQGVTGVAEDDQLALASDDPAVVAHEVAHYLQGRASRGELPRGGGDAEAQAVEVEEAWASGGEAPSSYAPASGRQFRRVDPSALPENKMVQGVAGEDVFGGTQGDKVTSDEISEEEKRWIKEVQAIPAVRKLFAAFPYVPPVTVYRVKKTLQEKGFYLPDSDVVVVGNKASTKEGAAQSRRSLEDTFKRTLLHELVHFFVNRAQREKKGPLIPRDLIAMMERDSDHRFGWFYHPKLRGYFNLAHKGIEDKKVDPRGTAWFGQVRARAESVPWEAPMSTNGTQSVEEDLCDTMAAWLLTPTDVPPKRAFLMESYFGNLPKID